MNRMRGRELVLYQEGNRRKQIRREILRFRFVRIGAVGVFEPNMRDFVSDALPQPAEVCGRVEADEGGVDSVVSR